MKTFKYILSICSLMCFHQLLAQNSCEEAIVITEENLNLSGNTAGPNDNFTSGALPCYTTVGTGGQDWYQFTPQNDLDITLTTCDPGTNFDTKIHVYTGVCGNLICVGGGDDDYSCEFMSGLHSTVTFQAAAGFTYYIRVGGFGPAEGSYGMSISSVISNENYGCTDPAACNYEELAVVNLYCDYSCYGCTDPSACNYDATSTVDDGSCCFENCVFVSIGTGSFPDEITCIIKDENNNIVSDLNAGFAGNVCLTSGCYLVEAHDFFGDGWNGAVLNVLYNGVSYVNEIPSGAVEYYVLSVNATDCSLECADPNACNFNPNATSNLMCDYSCLGCTDSLACNYNSESTIDDNSCVYSSNCEGCTDIDACNYESDALYEDNSCYYNCANCTDPLACNFNINATEDDGSCCYDNCLIINVGTGSFSSEISWVLSDENGNVVMEGVAPYSGSICSSSGCYSFEAFDSFGDGWNGAFLNISHNGESLVEDIPSGSLETYLFSTDESPCVGGCIDPTACNYNEEATVQMGTCLYGDECFGCLDYLAQNYNEQAIFDDGSCLYSISGVVYNDSDLNGFQDWYEYGLANREVYVESLGLTVITDVDGWYYISDLAPGSYTLSLQNTPENWIITTNSAYEIDIPADGLQYTFGSAIGTGEAFTVFPLNNVAFPEIIFCDGEYETGFNVTNEGDIPFSGTVSITYDPLLEIIEYLGIPPTEISEGLLTWNFTELESGSFLQLAANFASPGLDYIGEMFTFDISIELHNALNEEFYSQAITYIPTVACAYDPNDKIGIPAGFAEPHFIEPGTEMLYRIRFQNTGNFPATHVRVRDMIDTTKFDLASLQPIYSSHDMVTCKYQDGTVDFMFNNIMLPDSVNDEPNSHGMLIYQISPLSDLVHGSELNNTASIYFDSNPPIVTNTTLHTIFECNSINSELTGLDLCPDEAGTLDATEEYITDYSWEVNGETLAETSPVVEVVQSNPDDYTYTVTLTNPYCAVPFETIVNVHSLPDNTLTYSSGVLSAAEGSSFVWYFNGQIIEGENNSTLTPELEGSYSVQITNEWNCSVMSEEVQITSINRLSETLISVYPNPVSNACFVSLPEGKYDVKLFNSLGSLIFEKTRVQGLLELDLRKFESGNYTIVIMDSNGKLTSKIITKV